MTDMVVSDAGFAYVVGGVARNCPEGLCIYDVALIKYTPSGDTAWVRYFGSSAFNEQPIAVRLSSTGDVIIAGRMNETQDFLTLAFSNNGTLRWQQVYDGPDHSVDFPTGMTIDSHGNVIVAGTSWNNAEAFNYSVVKYSLSGQQLWAAQFNGSGNTRDFCYGVATDTNRNVYVTGSSVSGFTGPSRCSTVKFNHNGGHVWTATYDAPDHTYDGGKAVFVDNSDNVYVGGDGVGTTNGSNYLAIKYRQSPTGVIPLTDGTPDRFELFQNYPNPFNPSTTINISLPVLSDFTLTIYDVLGREVKSFAFERVPAGVHGVVWDGRDGEGKQVASGVYFYQLRSNATLLTKRMLLLR
jgi:hypothetical protein